MLNIIIVIITDKGVADAVFKAKRIDNGNY